MGQKDKLISKLISHPKDLTFNEAVTLLKYFDYTLDNKGKTSGSRVIFVNRRSGCTILMHKPHSGKELLDYQIKQLIDQLRQEGLI
jgi:hypothetical protein